ncbi:hypothetical protein ONA24_02050 [Mycoplasmopsis cynos]|uniref:hypothetical protein n=1 Tax=Mycoplasmopsis cynos TaxID=171284 RepID=UPI0024CBFED9|nr:hypothetical protein [Mycoplasmopsis cynos]WAM10064.1 hypothetical protein ONA24_02050 [Mycoplasmopsis cynos]
MSWIYSKPKLINPFEICFWCMKIWSTLCEAKKASVTPGLSINERYPISYDKKFPLFNSLSVYLDFPVFSSRKISP